MAEIRETVEQKVHYLDVELPGARAMRWAARLVARTWLPLVLAVLLGWLSSGLNVVASSLIGFVVAGSRGSTSGLVLPSWALQYLREAPSPELAALGLALGLTLAGGLLSMVGDWTFTWVHLLINKTLTPQVIEASVSGLPERSLDPATAVQRWLCKYDIVYFLCESVAAPIRDIGTITIAVVATYKANASAGHVSVLCLVLWLVMGAFLSLKALQASRRAARSHEMVGRVVRDSVSLRRDISRPSLIRYWVGRNAGNVLHLQQAIFWQGTWNAALGGVLGTIALGLPLAAAIAASKTAGSGVVLAILLYLSRLGGPLHSLARVLPWLQQNLITIQRVFAVIDRFQKAAGPPVTPFPPKHDAKLMVANWSVPVDKGKTIHYPAISASSRVTCVVGPSGSGKSTLLHSLVGFQRHASGAVRWNDELVEPASAQWRETCCLLPQEPELVPGSVRDNLHDFPSWTSTTHLEEAAQAVLQGVTLGEGCTVSIDEKGVSVGQRRALCLLRTLGSDATVLLLDEPITGIDDRLAALLGRAIERAQTQGKKVILTCHQHDFPRLGLAEPSVVRLASC